MMKTKANLLLRRCLFLVLAVTMCFAMSLTANAEEGDYVTIDGFLCEELADGTLCIISRSGAYPESLVVPAKLGDYAVTVVGNSAFDAMEDLTEVVIEEGITTLEAYAFMGCTNLVSMTLPDSLMSFGSNCLEGVPWVESLADENGFAVNKGHLLGYFGDSLTPVIPQGVKYLSGRFSGMYVGQESLITSVTLPEGVERIGEYVFFSCIELTEVILPNSLRYIGDSAFGRCAALTEIVLPEGVTEIGEYAFTYCDALKKVVLPDSLECIGENAFYDCEALVDVNLPDGVQLGKQAFENTPWLANQTDENGFVISGASLIRYLGGDEHVVVPAGITDICDYAFYNNASLLTVTLPEGLKRIGDFAFNKAVALKSVNIPDGVTYVGQAAFGNCGCLWTVNLPDSVEHVGDRLFELSGIRYVTFPKGITEIPRRTFYLCEGLTEIEIPNTVTVIRDNAFYGTALTELVIPDSVQVIEKKAFETCHALTSVDFGSGLERIEDYAFRWCDGLTTVTIPGNVESIGQYAFECCKSLTAFVMEEGVLSLGRYAFSYCEQLLDITFPESLIYIGCGSLEDTIWYLYSSESSDFIVVNDILYDYCGEAAELTVPENVTVVGEKAFYSCTAETVVIPEGVTEIWDYAFNYAKLTNLHLPKSLDSISYSVFAGCSDLTTIQYGGLAADWEAVTVQELSAAQISEVDVYLADGSLYGASSGVTVSYDEATATLTIGGSGSTADASDEINAYEDTAVHVVIEEGITEIADSALSYFKQMTDVVIPDTVTVIGKSAFRNCEALTSVTIPESVTEMKFGAFLYCKALTEVHMTASMGVLPESAFFGCDALTEFTIPEGITEIGPKAFNSCDGLKKITIPATVTVIDDAAFAACGALEAVYYGGNLEQWNAVEIGTGNSYLLDAALYINGGEPAPELQPITWVYNEETHTLTISGQVEMDDYVAPDEEGTHAPWLIYSDEIETIIIENGVRSIGKSAFWGCSAVTELVIADTVETIKQYAFFGLTSLSSVEIPARVTAMGEQAFVNNPSLRYISVDENNSTYCSVNGVLYYAGMSSIVKMPDAMEGEYAIPVGVRAVKNYAFQGSKLSCIVIPEGVTEIGYGGLAESAITEVHLPATLQSVDSGAFGDCEQLKQVYYAGTEALWNGVEISSMWNDPLFHAEMHYGTSECIHEDIWRRSGKEATCTEEGRTVGLTCNDCEAVLAEQIVIPAGHRWNHVAAKDADCLEDGYEEGTCGVCGVTEILSTEPALGHSYENGACIRCGEADPDPAPTPTPTPVVTPTPTPVVDENSYGANITWDVYDGILYFAGSGEMKALQKGETAPWITAGYGDQIVKVVVQEGITSIGAGCIKDLPGLTNVKIPESVVYIGTENFENTAKVSRIDFGGSKSMWGKVATEADTYNRMCNIPVYMAKRDPVVTPTPIVTPTPTPVVTPTPTPVVTPEPTPVVTPEPTEKPGINGYNGMCHWNFYDGVLTISGEGATGGYYYTWQTEKTDAPWFGGANGLNEGYGNFASQIREIVVEEGITEISQHVFACLKNVEKVTLPSTVTSIGDGAFRLCKNLETINLPDGLTEIGSYAFEETSLTEVDIPGSVETVASYAFVFCYDLKTVRINEGITEIGTQAFAKNSSLTTLYLPVTLTAIKGTDTFYACNALQDVYYAGTEAGWAQIDIQTQTRQVLEKATIHYGGAPTPPKPTQLPVVSPTPTVKPEPLPVNPFKDVGESDYFYTPVIWAVERGITGGTGPDTFSPNSPCTRGQVVTFLWAASGRPEPKSSVNPFTDVYSSDYYCKAVLWAVENGITGGIGNNMFGPNNPCTRAQVATFLWKAQGGEIVKTPNSFVDVPNGAYYYNAVLWAVDNGVTGGVGNNCFGPDQTCTRGQIATFLYKAVG